MLQTESELRRILLARGFKPSKSLGQNFLVDHNLLQLIAREAELSKEDFVLEVGGGTGLLSTYLAREAGWLFSVEIDARLCEIWHQFMDGVPNAEIINADILCSKHSLNEEVKRRAWTRFRELGLRRLKCVSNLPYSVGTSVIVSLLEEGVDLLVVSVQKELGEKMAAPEGSRDRGLIGTVVQMLGVPRIRRVISRTVFYPRPRVDTVLLRIEPRPRPGRYAAMKLVASLLYRYRRKTIASAIKLVFQLPGKEVVKKAGLPERLRAELLDAPSLLRLTQTLEDEYGRCNHGTGYVAAF